MKQGSHEWKEVRRQHIGSSDAPVIWGVSPWTTIEQLWLEKLGLGEEKEETFPQKWGKMKEEEARKEFEKQTGHVVFPKVMFHPEKQMLMASLDGIDIEGKHMVELKCPLSKEDHQMAMDGVVPEKYMPQLQHQLFVVGIPVMYYFSYSEKSSKVLYIERDEKFISELIPKEEEFWACVQELRTPKGKYTVVEDQSWVNVANQYMEIEKKLKGYEQVKEDLKAQLIELAGTSPTKIGNLKLTPAVRKGSIDYSLIPELSDVDLESYRKKPTSYWRIAV